MTQVSGALDRTDPVEARLSKAIDQIPLRRNHALILLLIGVGTLFNAIEGYNVGYAAPFLVEQWGLSTTQVTMLTTFTFGGLALGAVIAGVTGDRWGRRVTYMFSLLLFSIGGFVSAFSPNYEFLLVARVVAGIGLGGEIAVALTIVSEIMPTRVRGAALGFVNIAGGGAGIFAASGMSALILGPLSGPLGGDTMAWRYLLGILVVPALFIYYFRRYIPESPRHLIETGRVDEVNHALSRLASGRLRPGKDLAVTEYIPAETVPERQATTRLAEIFEGVLLRRTVVLWVMAIMTFGAQVTITSLWPTILIWKGFSTDASLNMTLVINIGSLLGAIAAATCGHLLPRRVTLC
ncbi:MFS transporter, partial [Actinomadura adrarensis]